MGILNYFREKEVHYNRILCLRGKGKRKTYSNARNTCGGGWGGYENYSNQRRINTMDREKLAKIRERFPYVDMCLDKKSHTVTVSVDTLYDLMFTAEVV